MRYTLIILTSLFVLPTFAGTHTTTNGRPLAPKTQEDADALIVLKLAKELSHRDELVREYAARELGSLGGKAARAVPFLLRAHRLKVDRAAKQAIIDIGEPGLAYIDEELARRFYANAINQRKIDALLAKYPHDLRSPEFVAEIEKMGERALEYLINVIRHNRANPHSSRHYFIYHVIPHDLIVAMGDKAVPTLRRYFLAEKGEWNYLRAHIAQILRRISSETSMDVLLDGFSNPHVPDKLVLKALIRGSEPPFSDKVSQRLVNEIVPHLRNHSDDYNQTMAIGLAGRVGHLNAAQILPLLRDVIEKDGRWREKAQIALKKITSRLPVKRAATYME